MKRLYFFIIILLFPLSSVFAQNGVITGKVINSKNNEAVPFANIIIDGSTIGTSSDIDGNFEIRGLEPGYVRLKASSIGFEPYLGNDILVSNARSANTEIILVEKTVNLSSVEIKTQAFEKREESPLSMRTLGIQEIEKNPGANRDISKVIQSFPGVASTPSFRNDVIVRGGGASENRFYLDDVEIPNLNHFATQGASGGPVGIINTDFIREVDFYSGSFPASRGNALSSLIDLKQIDGSKDKLNFKMTLGASDYGLTMDGPLGKKASFLLSARRSYLQLLFSLLELPFLPTYNDFQLKTRINFDNKHQLTIIGLGAIDQFKLNLKANKTEEQQYILSYLPVNEQWNYTLGVVYKQFRTNSYDTWVLSRNMLRNTSVKYRNNDDTEADNLIRDYSSDEIENKFRYENTRRINGLKIVYGAGAEYAKYSNDTYQKFFINNQVITNTYRSRLELYKWNVFIQLSKGFFGERLLITAGARTDANSYNKKMSNLLNQYSPRVSATYMFTERWSVNMNLGRYYQQPAYTSLGYRNSTGDLVNKENDIRYISADHAVIGVGYEDHNHFQITTEAFYKSYRHYPFSVTDSISLASKGTEFTSFGDEEVLSISKGRAYGLELLFRIKMLKGFNVLASYTFVRSEFTGNDNTYIPSAWDNKHLFNLILSKQFKHNWYIGMKWKFLGGAPYTPYDLYNSSLIEAWNTNGRPFPDYSIYNSKRVKSYHQLDLRFDKEFYWKKWSLNLYVDVQNVYNFKAVGPDNYILMRDENGIPLTDPTDPTRYLLKPITNETGTILPTLGIIIQL